MTNPTLENGKSFMVFEDGPATVENYMFEGDLLNFADMYFAAKDWDEVVEFAAKFGHTLVVDGTPLYAEMTSELNHASEADDFYDENGNCSPSGMYDAGGHMHIERLMDFDDR
jgi:hypothetical protein